MPITSANLTAKIDQSIKHKLVSEKQIEQQKPLSANTTKSVVETTDDGVLLSSSASGAAVINLLRKSQDYFVPSLPTTVPPTPNRDLILGKIQQLGDFPPSSNDTGLSFNSSINLFVEALLYILDKVLPAQERAVALMQKAQNTLTNSSFTSLEATIKVGMGMANNAEMQMKNDAYQQEAAAFIQAAGALASAAGIGLSTLKTNKMEEAGFKTGQERLGSAEKLLAQEKEVLAKIGDPSDLEKMLSENKADNDKEDNAAESSVQKHADNYENFAKRTRVDVENDQLSGKAITKFNQEREDFEKGNGLVDKSGEFVSDEITALKNDHDKMTDILAKRPEKLAVKSADSTIQKAADKALESLKTTAADGKECYNFFSHNEKSDETVAVLEEKDAKGAGTGKFYLAKISKDNKFTRLGDVDGFDKTYYDSLLGNTSYCVTNRAALARISSFRADELKDAMDSLPTELNLNFSKGAGDQGLAQRALAAMKTKDGGYNLFHTDKDEGTFFVHKECGLSSTKFSLCRVDKTGNLTRMGGLTGKNLESAYDKVIANRSYLQQHESSMKSIGEQRFSSISLENIKIEETELGIDEVGTSAGSTALKPRELASMVNKLKNKEGFFEPFHQDESGITFIGKRSVSGQDKYFLGRVDYSGKLNDYGYIADGDKLFSNGSYDKLSSNGITFIGKKSISGTDEYFFGHVDCSGKIKEYKEIKGSEFTPGDAFIREREVYNPENNTRDPDDVIGLEANHYSRYYRKLLTPDGSSEYQSLVAKFDGSLPNGQKNIPTATLLDDDYSISQDQFKPQLAKAYDTVRRAKRASASLKTYTDKVKEYEGEGFGSNGHLVKALQNATTARTRRSAFYQIIGQSVYAACMVFGGVLQGEATTQQAEAQYNSTASQLFAQAGMNLLNQSQSDKQQIDGAIADIITAVWQAVASTLQAAEEASRCQN